ncbi:PTS lactose/cellobiose transporter subunit IIA [Priestia megaterium]|uniref:PTS cellobiose transporter subunit IIA n=1 Tax=Priestia megaterium TaxID=1404 RepID=A0A6M6E147_PRIMG|nr:PTS lactose/cellobiose transporter subunit IIA [Priestia megaterium]QJX80662.1 PTS cellobiose transporter subunit IIA [Priestia megaterium]
MNREEIYDISFQLILHSGNARSLSMEAIYESKNGNFKTASEKLLEAGTELNLAHKFQTQLIQSEAGGDKYDISIILVHAQDHLMTAMTLKDLAVELVEIREEIKTR